MEINLYLYLYNTFSILPNNQASVMLQKIAVNIFADNFILYIF